MKRIKYEMTTSIKFCLSYDPIKCDFVAFKLSIISVSKRLLTQSLSIMLHVHTKMLVQVWSYEIYGIKNSDVIMIICLNFPNYWHHHLKKKEIYLLVKQADVLVWCARKTDITSFCSYARPAQPGPNRTRLCGPCIAAIAGD